MRKRTPFWDHVTKTQTCWLWTGAVSTSGYGRYGDRYAHRIAIELKKGNPIPDGLTIDHLCRTPLCVRPDHLEIVPLRENILRGVSPPAQNARRNKCVNGHPFTKVNTYLRTDRPGRMCLTCARERQRQYYAAGQWSPSKIATRRLQNGTDPRDRKKQRD